MTLYFKIFAFQSMKIIATKQIDGGLKKQVNYTLVYMYRVWFIGIENIKVIIQTLLFQ